MDETIGQSCPRGLPIADVSLLPVQEVYRNDSKTFEYKGPNIMESPSLSLHGLLQTDVELRAA